MTRVVIIGDTHIRGTAATLPDGVENLLETADHVLHTGDFTTPTARFDLRVAAGGSMTAVRGNRDRGLSLPRIATYEAGGTRFVLTHGDQFDRGKAYRHGLASLGEAHDAAVAVGGHTHTVLDDHRDGIRLLNPGSATGAAPASDPTALTVDSRAGKVVVQTRQLSR